MFAEGTAGFSPQVNRLEPPVQEYSTRPAFRKLKNIKNKRRDRHIQYATIKYGHQTPTWKRNKRSPEGDGLSCFHAEDRQVALKF